MSSRFDVDRESFQNILANAYVVQQSGVDSRSLRAVVHLEQAIHSGQVELAEFMNMTAECARRVANAAGVAVALVSGDSLVYRAGSGSAAASVGRELTAVLRVPHHAGKQREILRVENAQTDTRIEAAVCRQFGAESLLIVPIYSGSSLFGVIKILFSEAHGFSEQEVQTYHLMSGLIGEAITGRDRLLSPVAAKVEASRPQCGEGTVVDVQLPVPTAGAHNTEPNFAHLSPNWDLAWACLMSGLREIQVRVGQLRAMGKEAWKHAQTWETRSHLSGRVMLPALAMVGIVLVSFLYIEYRPNVSQGAASTTPLLAVPEVVQPSSAANASLLEAASLKTSSVNSRWVRVSKNELDQVFSDVTVRYFEPNSILKRTNAKRSKVHYMSDDVTIRYFEPGEQVPRHATEPIRRDVSLK
jgi:GAF domain-containing protein